MRSSVRSKTSSTRSRSGLLSEARRSLDSRCGPDYAGKPRPAAILQDDAFDATASTTLCPFTTHAVDAPLVRLPIEPSEGNGLRAASHLMIDKITTVSKKKLQRRVGRLSDEDIVRVNRAILVFLGVAGHAAK